jgi:hypothetical protein
MAYKLTPDLVRGLAKHLTKKHDTRIVTKDDAIAMELVGSLLALMKIQKKSAFMKHYATTLVPPLFVTTPTIYLPFELGKATKAVPLSRHVEILCHEHHHVRQWQKDPARFILRYGTSKAKRAWYEARAYHVDLEMHWFLTGKLPNLGKLAAALYAYGCTAADVRTVEKHLRIVAEVVKRGGLHNRVSKDAIAWLKRHRRRR